MKNEFLILFLLGLIHSKNLPAEIDIEQNILVHTILVPLITNSTTTFKQAVQTFVNVHATSKQVKSLLKKPNNATTLFNAFIIKFQDAALSTMLNNVTNAQEAQLILIDIAKGPALFINQYQKRSTEDLRYMNKLVVALLRQKGAQINAPADIPVLIYAIEFQPFNREPYFVNALLAHNADPHQRNKNSQTPLMIAEIRGKPESYTTLLKYGAD